MTNPLIISALFVFAKIGIFFNILKTQNTTLAYIVYLLVQDKVTIPYSDSIYSFCWLTHEIFFYCLQIQISSSRFRIQSQGNCSLHNLKIVLIGFYD